MRFRAAACVVVIGIGSALTELKVLMLRRTRGTAAGGKKLDEALHKCLVSYSVRD